MSQTRNITSTAWTPYNMTEDPWDFFTDYDDTGYEKVSYVIGTVTTAIASLAVVENIIALILLGLKSNAVIRTRRGFTISLALADTLVGLSWTVFFLVLRFHVTAGILMHYLSSFIMSVCTAGLWSLFSLVLDRYLVIRNPLRPSNIAKARIPIVCLFIWILSIGVNFSNLAIENPILYVLLMFIPRLPPCFGSIILYLMIHRIAFKSKQRMTRKRTDNRFEPVGAGSFTSQLREAKRSVFLFSIVCLVYILGLVTHVSLYIVQIKRCELGCVVEDHYGIIISQEVSKAVLIGSSALNPWIHTFRIRSFYLYVKRGLCPGKINQSASFDNAGTSAVPMM